MLRVSWAVCVMPGFDFEVEEILEIKHDSVLCGVLYHEFSMYRIECDSRIMRGPSSRANNDL